MTLGVTSRPQQIEAEAGESCRQYSEGENHAEKVNIIGQRPLVKGQDRLRGLKGKEPGKKETDLISIPQISRCGSPLGY